MGGGQRSGNFWSSITRCAANSSSPTRANGPLLTRRAVEKQGQSYAVAIERALNEGRISEEVARVQRSRTA